MLRSCMLFAAVLFVLPALAAPVPNAKEAKRKELEELFDCLFLKHSDIPPRALLALATRSPDEVTAFLSAKLKPLTLSKKRAKELIAALSSDKEAVVDAAIDEMEAFDVRLALTAEEAFKEAPQGIARQRLVSVWLDNHVTGFRGCQIEIGNWTEKGPDGLDQRKSGLIIEEDGKKENEELLLTVSGVDLPTWREASRAILVLEHHATLEAVAVLKRMATGHPDAAPTRAAKAALERLAAKPQKPDFDKVWADLGTFGIESDRAMLVLHKHPAEAMKLFQQMAKPLALTEKRCEELLSELGSDDEKKWRAAWAEFEYFDPRLALDVPTLFGSVPEGLANSRLAEFLCGAKPDSMKGRTFTAEALVNSVDRDVIEYEITDGKTEWRVPKLNAVWNQQHRRLYCVDILLDQIGTPEAIKLLEKMATGHPQTHPANVAKVILELRNKK